MVVNVPNGYVVQGVGKVNEVLESNEEPGAKWWNTLMKLANCIVNDDGCIKKKSWVRQQVREGNSQKLFREYVGSIGMLKTG